MCEEIKFEPTERTASSSVAMDTRSILRVPSLNSSASASASTARPTNLPEERSSVSSIGILDYTGSPLRQHTTAKYPANKFLAGHQLGPPAYVNYRPEEMNLTQDGWQLSSKYNGQGVWPGINGMMPSRKVIEIGHQTMSPYSPIRIRSSRGAPRRHSMSSSVNNSPSAVSSPLDDSSTTTSSSRGFPISNRGMGRRKIVVSTSTTGTVKGHSLDNTNDEVVMLKNLTATNLPTSDESQDKSIEVKFPRSSLKRKLPLMVPVPTKDEATTTSA
jgi:hypothetical protein